MVRNAERALKVDQESRRKESAHLTLQYAGDKTSQQLTQELLATMENQYQDLGHQLSYEPAENIIVILYTQKEFVDITEAPSWAGALNDGKLRIPIGGVTAMNSELQRVLKHELTQSFIASLSGGRVPVCLNDGVATLVDPRSASR